MPLNKTNAAALAGSWARFYHAAKIDDAANIKAHADALKLAQAETGVTIWDATMIDLKVAHLTNGGGK